MEFAFILLVAGIWAWREFAKTARLETIERQLEEMMSWAERNERAQDNLLNTVVGSANNVDHFCTELGLWETDTSTLERMDELKKRVERRKKKNE